MPLPFLIVRNAIRAIAAVAPPLAIPMAVRLFRTPPKTQPVEHTFTVEALGQKVGASSFGDGPAVILLHGWGGWPGQLDGFRRELLARGHRVVTLSPIGHGGAKPRRSSLIDFLESLNAVAAHIGEVHAVIGHSLGGVSTAVSVANGLPIKRLITIGSPARPHDFFNRFLDWLEFPARLRERAFAHVEKILHFAWSDLDVEAWGPKITIPLLAIHDSGDRDVVYDNALDVMKHVANARLITTRGLGHRRILDDPEVIRAAVDFATASDLAATQAS